MSLLDLLRDPLFRSVVLVLWLLPCALQDYRTRHVSNWLTVPLFLVAWPVALLLGNFPLTLATFIGVYVTFRMGTGMGAADGKIAVGLAGIAPPALLAGAIVQGLAFLYARLRSRQAVRLAGAVGFYLGAVIVTIIQVLLECTLAFA